MRNLVDMSSHTAHTNPPSLLPFRVLTDRRAPALRAVLTREDVVSQNADWYENVVFVMDNLHTPGYVV